nr:MULTISPECIES: DUF6701 domain-containing protein [unclassified Vibrio]
MVTRSKVSGNITTPNNAITVSDSDIVGSLTANGNINVTNSELKGDVTTSNNGINITETNVIGDLSANADIITDKSFITGNITSTNNQVTLNNQSYILGNVTAGQPDWGTVNVNGGSTVTGVCQYRTVPDNACGITPALKCFNDDFNHSDLTQNWVTFKSSGNFTPRIVSDRLRLTEAIGNQATAVTYQRIFPAAGNIVQVEFEHYAWANMLGVGGDGMAIIFSDASVTPKTGGYGGSLGYAPLIEMSVPVNKPGFAGGWLGIGIDEYGNFSNFNEGRNGGVGFRSQSVAVRGSQASNYLYLAGTQANLSPPIDVRAYCTRSFLGRCTQTAFDGEGPKHKYLITIDSRNPSNVTLKVERKYNSILEPETLIYREHLTAINNMETPEDLFLSITASTGGSVNHHEIDNFRVCALKSREVGEQVDHFRFTLPSSDALTCNAADVQIQACANSSCSELYQQPVSVNLSPNASPSASGGWVNGPHINFSNGIANLKLRRNTPGSVTVGVQNSTPTAKPFATNLCRYGTGDYSAQNCSLVFSDSGFIIDVPHAYANQLVTGTITALSKGDNPEQCIPSFAGVDKDVSLWSEYLTPSGGPSFLAMNVVVDDSAISNNSAAPSHRSLYFDENGQAEFELTYREAGSLALHARFNGSGDEQDLQLTGQANFIRVPRALVLRTDSRFDMPPVDGACETLDPITECAPFAKSGEAFDLYIKAVAAEPNEDNDFTNNLGLTNYQQQSIILNHTLVEPSNGSAGSIGTLNYDHELGEVTTVQQSVSEVGVFDFSLVPPTSYLGLDLAEANLPISVASTGAIGRFTPYYLHLEGNTPSFSQACNTFTYLGQAMKFDRLPEISVAGRFYDELGTNGEGETENYKIGSWWRYSNPWLYRNFSAQSSGFNITDTETPGLLNPQEGFAWPGSVVIDISDFIARLENAQIRYDKPYAPVEPIAEGVILQLSIDDTKDLDGVCYQTSAGSGCIGYDFPSSESQNQRWGRLLIHDTYGPETTPLSQKVEAQYFSGERFLTNSDDSCSDLGSVNHFDFDPTDFTVLKSGTATPPEVKATLAPSLLSAGFANINFSAPGAENTGTIVSSYDLSTLLPWLSVDEDGNNSFEESVSGQVQFGLYRGNDRVIWWRELN